MPVECSPPPTPFGRPLKGAMRVDRRSRIHRILGLVPLSWVVVPVLRWLSAVAIVLQSTMVSLEPGNRGSGSASPPVSPPRDPAPGRPKAGPGPLGGLPRSGWGPTILGARSA
ncbi:hypothetical protein GCM10009097_30460 [Pigmentiphaga daeguensis]|uniref:Uncharacterized protein n=1 Tax=Pigmentiphaga daeguensis TaxID=414049 RepID=A0ABN1C3M4_9BURK